MLEFTCKCTEVFPIYIGGLVAALARCVLAEEGQIFLQNGVLAADRRIASGVKGHNLTTSVMPENEKVIAALRSISGLSRTTLNR